MQLNIKSDEAYRLASRLAELTGTSLTMAVTQSLQASVAAAERKHDRGMWAADVLEAARQLREELDRAGGEPLTSNHDFLYDDDGLPV